MAEPRSPDALAERVLALLADGTPRSTGELAAAVGVHRLGITRTMIRLKQQGRVVPCGRQPDAPGTGGWERGKASQQTVWTLPDTRR